MPKPKTSYSQNSSTTGITLGDTVVTLNSTVYLLDGFTFFPAPLQLNNKPLTTFANILKKATAFTSNVLNETGVRANSTVVRANSTTVRATGYTGSVPSYESSRNPTSWAEA